MRRLQRLVALVLAGCVAVLLAGCGTGPSPFDTAATVGSRSVPVDELRSALSTKAATGGPNGGPLPTTALADFSHQYLTLAIRHELLTEEARRDGVVVSAPDVDRTVAMAGGPAEAAANGFDPAMFRQIIADQMLATTLGRRVVRGFQVTVNCAAVPDRAAADALATRLAADPARAPLVTGQPPSVVNLANPSPRLPDCATSSLVFGLPAGTVAVVPPPSPQTAPDASNPTWTVIHVVSRIVPPVAPGPDPSSSSPRPIDDELSVVGRRLVQPLALQLGVTVNPRYGVWDPAQFGVVSDQASAGTVRPAGPPSP